MKIKHIATLLLTALLLPAGGAAKAQTHSLIINSSESGRIVVTPVDRIESMVVNDNRRIIIKRNSLISYIDLDEIEDMRIVDDFKYELEVSPDDICVDYQEQTVEIWVKSNLSREEDEYSCWTYQSRHHPDDGYWTSCSKYWNRLVVKIDENKTPNRRTAQYIITDGDRDITVDIIQYPKPEPKLYLTGLDFDQTYEDETTVSYVYFASLDAQDVTFDVVSSSPWKLMGEITVDWYTMDIDGDQVTMHLSRNDGRWPRVEFLGIENEDGMNTILGLRQESKDCYLHVGGDYLMDFDGEAQTYKVDVDSSSTWTVELEESNGWLSWTTTANSITYSLKENNIGGYRAANVIFKNSDGPERGQRIVQAPLPPEPSKESKTLNYIYINGRPIEGDEADFGGAKIVSQTYNNGKGEIVFDRPLKRIEAFAFLDCDDLTSVTFPSELEYIGKKAFAQCDNLTSVNFPNTLKEIDDYAFDACSSLQDIYVPESVDTYGANPFRNRPYLSSFYGPHAAHSGWILLNGTELVSFAPTGLSSYVVPDYVTKICAEASPAPVLEGDGVFGLSPCWDHDLRIRIRKEVWDEYRNAASWAKYREFMEKYNP